MYADTRPTPSNGLSFEIVRVIVPREAVEFVELTDGKPALDEETLKTVSNGRLLPASIEASFCCMVPDFDDSPPGLLSFFAPEQQNDTTHQKANFKQLDAKEKELAMKALQVEMEKHGKFNSFKPIPRNQLPRAATVISPVVVFTRKKDAVTGERAFKCRVTGNGSTISQEDTSTSNCDMVELRLCVLIASLFTKYKGDFGTADAEQGYLQARARGGKVYMIPPTMHPDYSSGMVWEVQSNLYGLPNAGAVFEDLVHSCLRKMGFSPVPGTKHMWSRPSKSGSVDGFICVYVDDFFAVGVEMSAADLLAELGKLLRINVNPPGAPVTFIGNTFTKENRIILQSQNH